MFFEDYAVAGLRGGRQPEGILLSSQLIPTSGIASFVVTRCNSSYASALRSACCVAFKVARHLRLKPQGWPPEASGLTEWSSMALASIDGLARLTPSEP
jgi:hypothetical protein